MFDFSFEISDLAGAVRDAQDYASGLVERVTEAFEELDGQVENCDRAIEALYDLNPDIFENSSSSLDEIVSIVRTAGQSLEGEKDELEDLKLSAESILEALDDVEHDVDYL